MPKSKSPHGQHLTPPPEPRTVPLHKRFPGQHIIRSTVWFPDKDEPTKYSFKLGYEGSLEPAIAKAIVALQVHQRKVTPAQLKLLEALAEALNPKKKPEPKK